MQPMQPAPQSRLVSLDAFRGLTIAAMILVNSPGTYRAVHPQLKHAEWNGWTFADTIFPAFLFIMGVSIVFSFAARRERGISRSRIERQALKRTAVLFGLGLFLNSYPLFHLFSIRIPGVLQRIALCHLFASAIVLKAGPRGRGLWLFGLLATYWLAMRFVPVPGIGSGVLEPGRNLAAYVDSLFLSGHMLYYYGTWDPEGLVSTIPAIATTLFGVLAGDWLRSPLSGGRKSMGMLFGGAALLLLGMLLNPLMPINKNIWTPTFSIFMAGLALVCLAAFYWTIDVRGYTRWATPFVIFGMNSIAIYCISVVLDTTMRFFRVADGAGSTISIRAYLYGDFVAPLAGPETASLLFAAACLCFLFLIAWAMWREKLFLRV